MAGVDKWVRHLRGAYFMEKSSRIRKGIGALKTIPESISSRFTSRAEKSICVVFSGAACSGDTEILRGISNVFTPKGYEIKVFRSGNNQTKEANILRTAISRKYEGIIIEPSKSEALCKHMDLYRKLDRIGIPYVFIRSTYPQTNEKPKLKVNDSRGSYLLTRHLIATGHTNIVGLFKADDAGGYARHSGYVEAFREAGLSYHPEWEIWFHSEDRFKKPVLVLDQLLAKHNDINGILCYSDITARVIIKYLEQKGYRVPEDIAVTGYGNTKLSEKGEIGLTTAEQPNVRLGSDAAEFLLREFGGAQEMDTGFEKILDPYIIIRRSSI